MKLQYRTAHRGDLTALVSMLANDPLGKTREDNATPINPAYIEAFKAINADPNNDLLIAELEGKIVGMLQLTYIPYLTHIGSCVA